MYPMQIAFTADINNFPLIVPQLKNLVAFNRQPMTVIVLHNIVPGTHQEAFTQITQAFAAYPQVKINFHYVSLELQKDAGLPVDTKTSALNLRLFLPIFGYTGRVLYLDLDICCFADFSELFDPQQVDMQGKSLGVCTDLNNHLEQFHKNKRFSQHPLEILRNAEFGKKNDYFNSGVLLIDLDCVVAKGKTQNSNLWLDLMPDYYNDYLPNVDQDYLNAVHLNDKVQLPVKYNYLMFCLEAQRYFFYHYKWDKVELAPSKLAQVQANLPVFIHFMGHKKAFKHPYKEFQDYYNFFANHSVEQIVSQPASFYQQLAHQFFTTFKYALCAVDYSIQDLGEDINYQNLERYQKTAPYATNLAVLNPFLVRKKNWYSFKTRLLNGGKKRQAWADKVYAAHQDFFASYAQAIESSQD
ncbi:glycosyltransferase [Psittacicella hinzii]|uniref:Glycosyl transferase family 8 n=1 Tax=Psittacicella hinzii TaxID=2028575 RepID=A0A3A1YPE2_9GAMM|nr:glycosyltransferase [Psittacicella hinzii]RIY40153.1 hypothetical protein CKF58_01060 [Psittacicella hinzii]